MHFETGHVGPELAPAAAHVSFQQECEGIGLFPLPWGEGGPRPALSPAGAGRAFARRGVMDVQGKQPAAARRRVRGWFAALIVAVLLFPSCSKKSQGGEGEDSEEGTANIVAEVTVTRVGRADIQSTLSVSGTVSALPNQDVRVSSLVPGRDHLLPPSSGRHGRERAS